MKISLKICISKKLFEQQKTFQFEIKLCFTFHPLKSPNKNFMAVGVEREKELCCMGNELIIGYRAKYHRIHETKTELFSLSSWDMKRGENPPIQYLI